MPNNHCATGLIFLSMPTKDTVQQFCYLYQCPQKTLCKSSAISINAHKRHCATVLLSLSMHTKDTVQQFCDLYQCPQKDTVQQFCYLYQCPQKTLFNSSDISINAHRRHCSTVLISLSMPTEDTVQQF